MRYLQDGSTWYKITLRYLNHDLLGRNSKDYIKEILGTALNKKATNTINFKH
jgi:hypothetical protein